MKINLLWWIVHYQLAHGWFMQVLVSCNSPNCWDHLGQGTLCGYYWPLNYRQKIISDLLALSLGFAVLQIQLYSIPFHLIPNFTVKLRWQSAAYCSKVILRLLGVPWHYIRVWWLIQNNWFAILKLISLKIWVDRWGRLEKNTTGQQLSTAFHIGILLSCCSNQLLMSFSCPILHLAFHSGSWMVCH